MSGSTNTTTTVLGGTFSIDPIAMDLVQLWCQPRHDYLKKKESRITYVCDVFKKVRNGIAKPFHMLLAGSFADIDDGAPVTLVVQSYEAAIALIRERAARRARLRGDGMPFDVRLRGLIDRETKAQCKVDVWQFRVCACPGDIEARVQLRQAIREYQIVFDEIAALLDSEWAKDQMVA
jgi:hypothetical protein